MHLFHIKQSTKVKNAIKLYKYNPALYHYNMSYEEYEALPELAVAYYSYHERIEFPVVIHEPVFMVSGTLKKLLKLYDNELVFRGLHAYDDRLDEKNVQMQSYWAIGVKEYECIHPDVKFYPNGGMEKLILKRENIPKKDIFKVAGIREERIIVSEAVVESILRRHMYGVEFEEIEIRA